MITATDLEFSYPVRAGSPAKPVLSGVDLDVRQGELLALVGVNGCGKSTLLQCLAGALRPHRGTIRIGPGGGEEIRRLSRRELARRVAVMHQSLPPVPGLTVRHLVEQGRYPHRGMLGLLSGDAGPAVDEALAAVGATHLAETEVDALSGGQRQNVRLAVVLAQRSPVLLLDEPTAHLDVRHQLLLLDLVRRQQRDRGLTIVAVLHDLDQAARYADRVVVLDAGRVVADGSAADVVTTELLREVFGVHGGTQVHPDGHHRVHIDAAVVG